MVEYEEIKMSLAPIKRAIKFAIDDAPVSKDAVEEMRTIIVDTIISISKAGFKYTTHAGRKTLSVEDIKQALE